MGHIGTFSRLYSECGLFITVLIVSDKPRTVVTKELISSFCIRSIMMLGRKQSLKGETMLADYGPEEALNESADIEWVNMVILLYVKKKCCS